MKCRRIRIANVGPVEEGEVDLRKVMVFMGPSNTGKSIVSRLIHALRQLESPPSLLRRLGHDGRKKVSGRDLSRLYGEAVLLHAGLERDGVVTHGRSSCRLTVSRNCGTSDLGLDFGLPPAAYSAHIDRLHDQEAGVARDTGVYIPSGRTGVVQSFADIIQLRLDFTKFALQTAMQSARSHAGERGARAPKREVVVPPRGSLPPHMVQFHDLVARTIMGRPSRQFNRSLSRVFGGTISRSSTGRLRQGRTVYRDAQGHKSPIGSAGSGLLASAPLLAGLHYVRGGGSLIVEEPEAHMEPSAQLALIGEMVSVSLPKNVQLLLTTHSDYVVKKLLALVANKRIRASDIGMYYFRRDGRPHARIERVPVDPVGAADQEMFRRALDSLVEEFSA